MIRKILTALICLILTSCGGFSVVAGLKFKKGVYTAAEAGGNPSHLSEVIKLNSGTVISFPRPIGECGAGVIFFGVLLPIIPIWGYLNSCDTKFSVNVSGFEVSNLRLRYGDKIYLPSETEKKFNYTKKSTLYGLLTEYKFHIPNFWKFRMADDKAIIVIGKTKDGKEFSEELPVKWGVMTYYNWSFP